MSMSTAFKVNIVSNGSEIGKAGQDAIAGDAVVGWVQPGKADLRNLFPLGRTNTIGIVY